MQAILFDGLAYGMLLFLIGVGLSITMGLMNFVNLAHGAFAMVGGYAASVAMARWGLGFAPALALAFVAAALAGGVLEILLFRRLYKAHPLDQVLLTIGVVFVATAVATYFFGSTMQPFTVPAALEGSVSLFGVQAAKYRLFLIAAGLVLVVALGLLLNRTRYGAMVRAAVDNRRVAQGTGIDVQRLFFLSFSLGCGLAGLGGALSLGMMSLDPSFPLKYMVLFLIVVCVGGAGTIAGPFAAALIVGVVDMASKYYLPEIGAFVIYAFMVLALLLRPHGLIVRRGLA